MSKKKKKRRKQEKIFLHDEQSPETLSLCMIVKNEEEWLPQCLESIKGVVDEIIVVDTGSTDKTVEIAKERGAFVSFFKWNNDFSSARNFSKTLAKGEWIIYLDADERLAPSSIPIINEAIRHKEFLGYIIPIHNYMTDDFDESSKDILVHSAIRLFQNKPEITFWGLIHEDVSPSIAKLGGESGCTTAFKGVTPILADAVIYHYGYSPKVAEKRKKGERSVKLLEEQLLVSPDNPLHLFNLAIAYHTQERFEEALPFFESASKLISGDELYAPALYSGWASSIYNLGRFSEAIQTCLTGLDYFPEHPEIHYTLAISLLASNELMEAIKEFDQSIRLGKIKKVFMGDLSTSGHKAYYGLGNAYTALNEWDKAIECFEKVIAEKPKHTSARYNLGVIYRTLKNREKSEEHLLALLEIEGEYRVKAHREIAELFVESGRISEAIKHYEKIIEIEPDNVFFYNELGILFTESGMYKEALDAYQKALTINPTECHTATVHNNIGMLYRKLGEIRKSLTHFEKAISINPKYSDAYFNIADLFYQEGEYDEALRFYEAGVILNPLSADGFFCLGNTYFKKQNYASAGIAYSKAIELRPSLIAAQHNLAIAISRIRR